MDRTNRNTALASGMVEELARCGLRDAVIAPGSRSTPLALALWRQPAIAARVVLDERSAAFVALGAAQATGRPTAVICTSGSAAANLHPAVVEADEAGVPLLVLTSDRPPELRGIGAGQTIDQLKLYGSAVRWFCDVGTHEADDDGLLHYRSVACRAYALAQGEPRPGPVHLNLAWREPLAPLPVEGEVTASSALALEGRGDRPLTAVVNPRGEAEPALLDELAERIADVPRGLIVAGRQPNQDLAEPVMELARAAGYPVLAEPTSQLRLGSHDRALVIWPYDAIARQAPSALAPDLVVRFGDMPTSKALRQWLASLDGLRQIVVDPAGGWNDPSRRVESVLRADPGLAARALAERLSPSETDWVKSWLGAASTVSAALEGELSGLSEPTEPGLHTALGRAYRDGDLVYTASSMPIRDQEAFLPSGPAAVRFLCNRGANGIDGLISSGIGAAAASRRPTWVITGDLGLRHDMNGLAALRNVETPVRIVTIENGGGAIFDFLPQAEALEPAEFDALFTTPSGTDAADIARVYGLDHVLIEDLGKLETLEQRTAVIEVPVDRATNVDLHARLVTGAAGALAAFTA